jgi:hypothetical protein
VIDQTEQPAPRRRWSRLAVAGATLALGAGALGAAATGAFADAGGEGAASATSGGMTTFVQDGGTTPRAPAAPGDCPGEGGSGDGAGGSSSAAPS